MYAIIECGGKQYRVQEGDAIRVEKLAVEVGATVDIDKVLLISGDDVVVGKPYIEGAVVSCKVLNQDKSKKVLVFHYKAKKNIRKKYGHRQPFTSILIEKITKDGVVSETSEAATAKKAVKAVKEETAATSETVVKKASRAKKTEAAEVATDAVEVKATKTRKTTKTEKTEA